MINPLPHRQKRVVGSKDSDPPLALIDGDVVATVAAEAAGDGVRGGLTRGSDPSALFAEAKAALERRPRCAYPLPLRGGQRGMAKGGLGAPTFR